MDCLLEPVGMPASEIHLGHSQTRAIATRILALSSPCSSLLLLTDTNLTALGHAGALSRALVVALDQMEGRSTRIISLSLPPGEAFKTRRTKEVIEDFLLENHVTRDSCILALGGGVIGDMVGYVAATFMRGVPVIQIPTTLLAMVDSSIGGKTAVDTPHGKNLVGAFHQPRAIFMDTSYLLTLPFREFCNGMAEVIKTAVVSSLEEFEYLESNIEAIMAFARGETRHRDIVVQAIKASAGYKSRIVQFDERESGIRALLNFGHSIGHAIEALLTPHILHGECVAIGIVLELEIARNAGYVTTSEVARVTRVLAAYNLPVSLNDARITGRVDISVCSVDRLMEVMRIDKKNTGDRKNIVLIKGIGGVVAERALPVEDAVIRKILSPTVRVHPVDVKGKTFELRVPGSKSISNRALLLAALGKGRCRLTGLLISDDVQVMLLALESLVGISYTWAEDGALILEGGAGRLSHPSQEIYLGNAGTASRFLTSVCTLIKGGGSTVITGNSRMKARPIGPLVEALIGNGASVDYLESEGSLPLRIGGVGLAGGEIRLSASISSQYVSSILMAAPYASKPVTLVLVGDAVISRPYIDMTIKMMEAFGIRVESDATRENTFHCPQGVYTNPTDYLIEADASSATYPLAFAAATGASVTVLNIGEKSMQGDSAFATSVLKKMGCAVSQTYTTTTVTGPAGSLLPLERIDMETMTDAFLTATTLAALAPGRTEIYGIANQHVKECDRIHAMVSQLAKFGVRGEELADGIVIHGPDSKSDIKMVGGVDAVSVYCFDDHRVAMSFSVLACGLKEPTLILERRCVEKTWPGWWDTLENTFGARLDGVDVSHSHEDEAVVSDSSNHENILLIGMRGTGKTKAGRMLAHVLSRQFLDLDEYLESQLGKSIPEIIKDQGWEYFREQEALLLVKALECYPDNTVMASGGGIVESAESRELLRKIAGRNVSLTSVSGSRSCHVIHIKRADFQQIVDYLGKDESRPSFGEDLHAVWQRRKSWYESCCSSEFVIVKNEDEPWSVVDRDLVQFAKCITCSSIAPVSDPSFFLSLTFPNLDALSADLVCDIVQGVSAVELRVDLLERMDLEFVSCQIFRLRRLLSSVEGDALPIIFTVRSVSQAGRFPDSNLKEMFDLLKLGIRCGCEFIDVEILAADGTTSSERLSMVKNLVACKGKSIIIGSFHDMHGKTSWDGGISTLIDFHSPILEARILGSLDMKSIYQKLHQFSDVMKLISKASCLSDNFKLQKFRNEIIPGLGLESRPLIALNMGALGQSSRALNTTLSPVTHSRLPVAAAPGQLTIKQIHSWRNLSGLLPDKSMYLFGSPITHSPSPALHNAGFEALGLPYTYKLYECSEPDVAKDFILAQVKSGAFGGASVTIPLKETLLAAGIYDTVTDSARDIGAVNTIIPSIEDGKDILIGDNTDWLGIRACITRFNPIGESKIGIVIGGGGTARAACYALGSLGCKTIRVWNRTSEKAIILAKSFSLVWPGLKFIPIVELCDVLSSLPSDSNVFVVATIPAEAQSSMELSELMAPIKNREAGRYDVLVELAYKPAVTPMMESFSILSGWNVVAGKQVLIEQGYEQFDRWTRLPVPKGVMRKALR